MWLSLYSSKICARETERGRGSPSQSGAVGTHHCLNHRVSANIVCSGVGRLKRHEANLNECPEEDGVVWITNAAAPCLLEERFAGVIVLDVLVEPRLRLVQRRAVVSEQQRLAEHVLAVVRIILLHQRFQVTLETRLGILNLSI